MPAACEWPATVQCWGSDEHGQSTAPAGGFASVGAGGFHTCGLRHASRARWTCWGRRDYAQSTSPTGSFLSISVGGFHACGLRDTGAVQCWGRNDRGQSSPPPGGFIAGQRWGLPHLWAARSVARWHVGEMTGMAGPRPLRAASPRSVPATITPAACGPRAPWNAGVQMSMARPRRRQALLPGSAPATITPAACGTDRSGRVLGIRCPWPVDAAYGRLCPDAGRRVAGLRAEEHRYHNLLAFR